MDNQFKDEAKLLSFRNKKVLILGLGINQGGLGSTKFFAKAGAKVKVTDLKDKEFLKPSLDQLKDFPEIEYVLGEHRYEDLDWADLIIRNPALKPDNQYLKYAKEKGKQVEMDMGIFLQFISPKQIIGVTGTKGKSTTASLIYEILRLHLRGGSTKLPSSHLGGVIFAGNIGKSVLDAIPYIKEETLVVLELSSFQLMAFGEHKVSPKWAVITNIYPDHLNYHGTMENYIEAKRFIAQFQGSEDFLFLKKGDEVTNSEKFTNGLSGKIVYYAPSDLPKDFSPKLPGEHNLANMAAALAISQAFGVDKNTVLKAMEDFAGVEFRLQLIYDKNGIKIYNDTAATTPAAAEANIKSLSGAIMIAGGVNKDLPYENLAQAISEHAKAVYFLEGDASDLLKSYLLNLKSNKIQGTYNNLEKLLTDIKAEAKPGDTILFSPGAASFNLFQNEFDRGRKFNAAVEKVFKS